jgi:hypothetical protein
VKKEIDLLWGRDHYCSGYSQRPTAIWPQHQ